jgi:hypothetical protein
MRPFQRALLYRRSTDGELRPHDIHRRSLVGVSPLQAAIQRHEFTFVHDACAGTFVICDPEIDSSDFSSL